MTKSRVTKKKVSSGPDKKLKKEKKLKSGLYIELNGEINLLDVENGITKRSELDPRVMLELLRNVVEDAIQAYLDSYNYDPIVHKVAKSKGILPPVKEIEDTVVDALVAKSVKGLKGKALKRSMKR
jgi:hypothetical protein